MTNMPYELEGLQSRLRMLENEVAFLYKHLNLPYGRESEDTPVIELIKNNDMPGALKLYCEIHVCSMDEAREGIKLLEQPGF